jgi:osmotically-inducible protein OsmY
MAKRYDDRYGRGGYRRDRDQADDRGYAERAGDEVRSWFGDDDAQRRRQIDEQRDRQQNYGRGSAWAREQHADWNRSNANPANWDDRARAGRSTQGTNWPEQNWRNENWRDESRGDDRWRGENWRNAENREPMRYQEGRQWSSSDWDRNRGMSGYQNRNFSEYGGQNYRDYDDARYRESQNLTRPSRSMGDWSVDEGRTEFRQQHHDKWGRGPKGYQRSDNRILEDVCDRLTYSDVDASEIEVRVENGEVTLSGSVNDRADKRRAEDVAEDVSGVRDVHNNIRVHRGDRGLGQSEKSASDQPGTVLGVNPTSSSTIANNNTPPKAIKS